MKKKSDTLRPGVVPEGITLGMALVDAVPVAFFCAGAVLLGVRTPSALFRLGAVLCAAAGAGKVLWKLLVAVRRRSVWVLNRQLRVLMPAGFVCMALGLVLARGRIDFAAVWRAALALPQVLLFALGAAGMVVMAVLGATQDPADPAANWKEQGVNSLAQAAIFLGILLCR